MAQLTALTLSTTTILANAQVGDIVALIGGVSAALTTAPTISVSADVTHNEGATGTTTTYDYTVAYSAGSTVTDRVVTATSAGYGSNPANGADFQGGVLPSGSHTFSGATASWTFTATVVGDATVEPDEMFQVTFALAGGNTVTARGTIVNDDAASGALTTLPTDQLLAYWDASDITGKSDGQTVTTWTDRVSGINAVAPSGAEPVFKTNVANGKPGLLFSGSQRMIVARAAALVAAMGNAKTWSVHIFYKNATGDGNSINGCLFGDSYSNIYLRANNQTAGPVGASTVYLGNDATHVHTLSYSGDAGADAGRYSLDGSQLVAPVGRTLSTDALAIGSTGGGGYYPGQAADTIGFRGHILGIALVAKGTTAPKTWQHHSYACANWGEASPIAGMLAFPLFEGDSQTQGTGTDPTHAYPFLIAQAKGWKHGQYAQVGKPSASTAPGSGSGNNLSDCAANDVDGWTAVTGLPTTIIGGEYYNQGGGDANAGTVAAGWTRTYMATRASANPMASIIWWTAHDSQRSGPGRDSYCSSLMANKGVAARMIAVHTDLNIGVDGTVWSGSAPVTATSDDGTHLNAGGYPFLAARIGPYIAVDGTVAPLPAGVPVNSRAPVISGTASVGQVLTVSDLGDWSNSPSSYNLQWKADGTAISGAKSTTFTLTSAQSGKTVTCGVTAENIAGKGAEAVSNGKAVAGSTPYVFTNSGLSYADGSKLEAQTGFTLLVGSVNNDGGTGTYVISGGNTRVPYGFAKGGVGRSAVADSAIVSFPYADTGNPGIMVFGKDAANHVTYAGIDVYNANNWEAHLSAIFDGTKYNAGFPAHITANPAPVAGDQLGFRQNVTAKTIDLVVKYAGASTWTTVATTDVTQFSGYAASKIGRVIGVSSGYALVSYDNSTPPPPYAAFRIDDSQ